TALRERGIIHATRGWSTGKLTLAGLRADTPVHGTGRRAPGPGSGHRQALAKGPGTRRKGPFFPAAQSRGGSGHADPREAPLADLVDPRAAGGDLQPLVLHPFAVHTDGALLYE